MCGICGLVRFSGIAAEDDPARLDRMVATLHHRGPDEKGLAIHDGVAMGMRRLAIIDLAGGSQPIYNEDNKVWTVFNGEIYNHPALKKELVGRGHIFATNSDTETIVHGYEAHGPEFPAILNGMFAIALHDQKEKKFFLARDHLGIKPLYYHVNRDFLVFGSEIKALLASGLINRETNLNGLASFLSWEYIPGRETLFDGIHKLLPGEMLTVDLARRGEAKRSLFWDVPLPDPDQDHACSGRKWEERIEEQLFRSTRMQMISDVPLGAFLSGGVDSSLIVTAMGQAQTFSIGFDDPSYNELDWARKVASHLGVSHTDEIIQPRVADLFDHLMQFMEDPIGDFSIFPTYLVSRLARQHVTVALSGDGGDELFAGYETYLAQRVCQQYERLPGWLRRRLIVPLVGLLPPTRKKKGLVNKARRFVEGAALPPLLAHARWRLFVSDQLRRHLFTPEALARITDPAGTHIERLFTRANNREELQRQLYVDLKSYLCDNILTKVDRMSMAVSLETRVPYLDPDMVALAFTVPARFKLQGRETKAILKRVAARHLPRECVYRPKEGFSIPIKHWLNKEFLPIMNNFLNRGRIQQAGIFQWPSIERLLAEHASGRENHSHILWALIVYHDWHERWMRP